MRPCPSPRSLATSLLALALLALGACSNYVPTVTVPDGATGMDPCPPAPIYTSPPTCTVVGQVCTYPDTVGRMPTCRCVATEPGMPSRFVCQPN